MHTLPERVVKNLDHLLVDERICGKRFDAGRNEHASVPGRAKVRAFPRIGKVERGTNFIVSIRRAESHDNIFGMKNGFQPRTELHGDIERRKRPLSDDHGMNKLDRDMLRVGGIGTASEG